MNKYTKNTLGGLVLAMAALGWAGCKPHAAGPAAPDGAPAKAGAEAKEEPKPETMTPQEILQAKCSHGILTHQCDECRYEVGVVKVAPELLKGASGSTNGLVRTAPAQKGKGTVVINLTGEIRLNENTAVHIRPRIPGMIRAVHVDLGTHVKQDDLLFTMESVELGQALSDYEKNLALVALSQKHFQREKDLYEQKIGAELEMIDARMKLEEYQAALKAAEQKLQVLGLADKDRAALAGDQAAPARGTLSVRAPLSGTIVEKHAVSGEWVEPGRDVLLLANLDTVWVWGNVSERDLAPLLKRMEQERLPAEVSIRAFPGQTFSGMLDHASAVMDEATRTVKMRVAIANPDRRLRPGMFCEARLLDTTTEEVLTIPKLALLSDEGADFVFTHLQGEFYRRQPVTRGREFADGIEILTGLEPGQTIVTEGAFLLKSDVLRAKMGAGCAD